MDDIVIATTKSWNIKHYDAMVERDQGRHRYHLITSPEELEYETLRRISPLYIFFPHWSWKVPKAIHRDFTCILFHMSDLPFGRGGSPLQNLITQGIHDTKVSAIQVVEELDAGDIYLQEPFDISSGSAQEIFTRASNLIFEKMIPALLADKPTPHPQEGPVTTFKRRSPEQSDLRSLSTPSIDKVYDLIRMLDAEGYPRAFLGLPGLRIEFSEVQREGERLVGRFEVITDA